MIFSSKEKPKLLKRNRQTKILATLGPATEGKEAIRAAFEAGVDCFRLNFSHGEHKEHEQRLKNIRAIEKEFNHPIAIVADLQGPKLRLGRFEKGSIEVSAGDKIQFDMNEAPGNNKRIAIPHPEIFDAVDVGQTILIDDGRVRVKIVEKNGDVMTGEIITGKKLSDRKGVNVPDVVLGISALTDKDVEDLDFALSIGVDWVALSFVQRPEDVRAVKDIIDGRASIISKIEKPSAIERFDGILQESDGIMLARGDLGVEMLPEQVPVVQKRIAAKVRQAGKPLVIATQMLESMVGSPMPTRAEASDVANAVYDGADAVMLSAETAAGDYPLEAVAMMDRIATHVEADAGYRKIMDTEHPEPHPTDAGAITVAASQVAQIIGANLIVNYTSSGSTTLRTVRERPSIPILCLTPSIDVARRLSLSYGVYPIASKDASRFSEIVEIAQEQATHHQFVETGDSFVITAGVPFGVSGTTNILRIARV